MNVVKIQLAVVLAMVGLAPAPLGCDGGVLVLTDDTGDTTGSGADSGLDSAADTDGQDSGLDTEDTPSTPGIHFTVPDGDLAGSYEYLVEVFCGLEEGVLVARAAEDLDGEAWLGFEFEQAPQSGESLEDFTLEWYPPSPWVNARGGDDCTFDVVDPWPSLSGTFECLEVTTHGGGGMGQTVDIVDGRLSCE